MQQNLLVGDVGPSFIYYYDGRVLGKYKIKINKSLCIAAVGEVAFVNIKNENIDVRNVMVMVFVNIKKKKLNAQNVGEVVFVSIKNNGI